MRPGGRPVLAGCRIFAGRGAPGPARQQSRPGGLVLAPADYAPWGLGALLPGSRASLSRCGRLSSPGRACWPPARPMARGSRCPADRRCLRAVSLWRCPQCPADRPVSSGPPVVQRTAGVQRTVSLGCDRSVSGRTVSLGRTVSTERTRQHGAGRQCRVDVGVWRDSRCRVGRRVGAGCRAWVAEEAGPRTLWSGAASMPPFHAGCFQALRGQGGDPGAGGGTARGCRAGAGRSASRLPSGLVG